MLWFAALLALSAPQQQCAAMDANLPAEVAAWATPGLGRPGDLTKPLTVPTLQPEYSSDLPASIKPGRVASARFTVDKPGTYGIAIDKPGWIDVLPDGSTAPLTSSRHGHGPACSTIRKIVRYDLKPGTYRIVVSGLTEINLRVMLVQPQ